MIEIIPAILVKTEEEFRERFDSVESLVSWVQIDVVDGKFAQNTTWGDPTAVAKLKTSVRFEIDLMVEDNEMGVRDWIAAAPTVGRIYFHQESSGNRAHTLITQIKKAGIEAGMSVSPKTSQGALYSFAPKLDAVLFLGVEPGFGGQVFIPSVLEKIRVFHEKFPLVPITVDGGVNVENAAELRRAGASRFAVGSSLFLHPQGPRAAIEKIRKTAEQ